MIEAVSLYWTVIAGVAFGAFAVFRLLRDRSAAAAAQSQAMVSRLLEFDLVTLQHPEIQKYLAQNACQPVEFFRSDEVLQDSLFFQAKSKVYWQLNFADEILSLSAANQSLPKFFLPADMIEKSDWDTYFKVKLSHPLFRCILIHEGKIFGTALRDFWETHRDEIEGESCDPFVW